MEIAHWLLDTNAILRHFADGFLSSATEETKFFVSVISEAELLRLQGLGERELQLIEQFLSICVSLPVDSKIARRAALLGRTRKTKLPDLLIAATAMQHRLVLVTLNEKDFRGIPDLKVRETM